MISSAGVYRLFPRKADVNGRPQAASAWGCWSRVQEIHSLLRMGGGAENCPLVVLKSCQPRSDVGSVVVPHFRRESQVGAQERGSQFGHQLLARIALVAPGLAAQCGSSR
jgi:hypothetical protein